MLFGVFYFEELNVDTANIFFSTQKIDQTPRSIIQVSTYLILNRAVARSENPGGHVMCPPWLR